MTLVAVALALSLALTSMLAWDGWRRAIEERASTRIQDNVLQEMTTRLDLQETVMKKLAEDWRAKFLELEADWKGLKQHVDSQTAGTLAQMTATQSRGFGR